MTEPSPEEIRAINSAEELLPHSEEGENAILSCLLKDWAIDQVMSAVEDNKLLAAHFYSPGRAIVFGLIKELYSENEPFDTIILCQILKDRQKLDKVCGMIGGEPCTGAVYITILGAHSAIPAMAAQYCKIVREKALMRHVITECYGLISKSQNWEGDSQELSTEVQKSMFRLAESAVSDRGAISNQERIGIIFDGIDASMESGGTISPGISTGIGSLDEALMKMRPAQYIALAGKRDSGKSSLALCIADHAAVNLRKGVLIFTLENTTMENLQRLIAIRSRVGIRKIIKGELSGDEIERIVKAGTELGTAPIHIEDQGGRNIIDIRATGRVMKSKHDIQLIVIDYFQKIAAHKRFEKESDKHSEISDQVKQMAKELNIPIIVISSMTGDNLKGSGDIEYDASSVLKIKAHDTAEPRRRTIHSCKREDNSIDLDFDPATGRWQDWVEYAEDLPERKRRK